MTPETHLDMLITRSYLDSLHEECDSPQFKTYQTLMAHKAVVVAAREKELPALQNIIINTLTT